MGMRCDKLLGLGCFLLSLAAASPSDKADAATATTTFQVTANVLVTCTISATDMNFGDYVGASINTRSEILINCTNTAQWNIGLSAGTAPDATVNNRRMTGPGGFFLNSTISPDPSVSYSWGAPGDPNSANGSGTGTAQVVTAFGFLGAGQSVGPGGYADTLTATITF